MKPPLSSAVEDAEAALAADLGQLRALLERDAIEAARTLVRSLQEKWSGSDQVQHYARVLAPPRVRVEDSGERAAYKTERAWLRRHGGEFPGCWLAVHGDCLVGVSPDPDEVERQLEAYPRREAVLLHFQPDLAGFG
jgi:hypothetical protein